MLSRRKFLLSAGLTAACGLGLTGCKTGFKRKSYAGKNQQNPNVLFIVLDDLNDWVGCLGGHPNAKTPNLDKFAAESMLFTSAYCTSPLCGPSRAAFLSGMRASTTGVYNNTDHYHEIMPDALNMPLFFKNNGYFSCGAGKIFHGMYPEYWHEFIPKSDRMYHAGEPKMNGTDIPGIFDWGALDVDDSEMDDYKMAQFAVDKLKAEHDKPFFLACGIYRPHAPWYAPKKYFDMHPIDKISMPVVKKDDLDDVPPAGVRVANLGYTKHVDAAGAAKKREAVQAYLASVTFADTQVGRVLKALDKSPYKDNTIVVVLGDHGLHLGEKNKWHKDTLWEESCRAPLMIRVPGMTEAGSVCERTVSFLDLYPTLVSLCGFDRPSHLEGRDITKILRNPDSEWDYPAVTHRRANQVTIRDSRWRYILYENGDEELYDHSKDPNEWHNLAADKKYDSVKEKLSLYIPK
jgi:arylsulfatase A-like enzyme